MAPPRPPDRIGRGGPGRGERRGPGGQPPPHRPDARAPRSWFAVAAPGLEAVVHAEVARLPGAEEVRAVAGGVEFRGALEVGLRANLHLRVASRVLVRLGTVKAREFGKLRHLLAKLDFADYVPGDRPLKITAAASRCRLYHTGALAETVALAVTDRVGTLPPPPEKVVPGEDAEEDEAPLTRLLLRGYDDTWVASVDASGALLHRRGHRLEIGKAPLRETLAAGLLALCDYDPARPFVDPMCGAGTIALEAHAIAIGRAPGLGRAFAFEGWPCFDAALWVRLQDEARAAVRPAPPAPILAFDRDPRAVERARRNAERAGAAAHVAFEAASFGERAVAGLPGLLLLNPPYGKRIGARDASGRLFREIGRALATRFPGWRAGVILPAPGLENALGLTPAALHPLSNGGLRVRLAVIDVRPR